MKELAKKPTLFLSQENRPSYRTLLDTTDRTPASICDPVPLRTIQKALKQKFAEHAIDIAPETETGHDLPLSVLLMGDIIFSVGQYLYDFPNEHGFTIWGVGNGQYEIIFTHGPEPAAEDNDGTYAIKVGTYLNKLSRTYNIPGITFKDKGFVIACDSKIALFTLLLEMVKDKESLFLVQPEEVSSLECMEFDVEDFHHYYGARKDMYLGEAKDVPASDLLRYSPMKPYHSFSEFAAQSCMTRECPMAINLIQIWAFLKREEKGNVPAILQSHVGVYTFGIN